LTKLGQIKERNIDRFVNNIYNYSLYVLDSTEALSVCVNSFSEIVRHSFEFCGNDGFDLFNNSDFGSSSFFVFSPFSSPFFALGNSGGSFFLASHDVGNSFVIYSLLESQSVLVLLELGSQIG